MRAQAADGLARVEAQFRTTPAVKAREDRRLALMRSIIELQSQVKTWTWLMAVARHETDVIRFGDDVDAEKEFPQ